MSDFEKDVTNVTTTIKNMLVEKNRKYGNAALEPIRVFSDSPVDEQIKVRLDDKISRLKNKQLDDDEDVIMDLIGYLILLMISKTKSNTEYEPSKILDEEVFLSKFNKLQ